MSPAGGADRGTDALERLETLGRDRVSATFLVRDAKGRRLIAREFAAISPGIRQHLPFVFRLQKSLRVPGLVVPESLREVGDTLLWVHRPVRGQPLSHCEFNAADALRFAARTTQLLAELHSRALFGVELRAERLFVDRGMRPLSTGLIAAPGVWDAKPGLASLLLGQTDARVDLAALGIVLRALVDRVRTRDPGGERTREDLEQLARLLEAPAPDDRPSLKDVIATLRELGSELAVELGGSAGAVESGATLTIPRLVGRGLLLREMEAVVERGLRGGSDAERRPLLLAVAGRPGVGKTRVLAELAIRGGRSGYDVFACRARVDDRRLLGPLEDVLAAAAVVRPASTADEPGQLLSPAAERRRQIEAAVRALMTSLGDRPALVLIEDLELLSMPVLEALSYVVREVALEEPAARARLFFVVSLRPADGGEAGAAASQVVEELREEGFAERVRLPPLDRDAIIEMLGSMGVEASDSSARMLERAGGNPRHIEELLRLQLEQGRESATLPALDVLRKRVRHSDEIEQQVLEALATLDRPAGLPLIAALIAAAHRPKLYGAAMRLVVRRLVVAVAGPAYELHNRDAAPGIRRKLSARRSKQLHRLAGRAIEQLVETPDAPLLAHHFELGGVGDRFLHFGRQAALELEETHANDQALELYSRVLSAVPTKDRELRSELLERCAHLSVLVGDLDGAADAYRELLELPHDPGTTWTYYKALGRVHRDKEDHVAAAESFDRGLKVLGQGNDLAVADLLSEKAILLARFGDVDTARGLADMAGALAERLDESRDVAEIRNRIGATYRIFGDHERAVSHMEACLRISEKVSARDLAGSALNGLGLYLSDHGERQRSLEYCLRSLEIAQRLGDVHSIAIRSANVGALYLRNFDLDNAEQVLQKGLRIARRFGRSFVATQCLSNLAELKFLRARYGEALEIRLRVLKMDERLGRTQDYANQLVALIRDYVLLGCADQAERFSRQLADIAARRDDPRLAALAQCGQAGTLALTGRGAEAERLLAEAEVTLRDIGGYEELIHCLLARANLDLQGGHDVEAAATAEEAVGLASKRGYHSDRAYGLLLMTETGLANGRLEEAGRQLREAEGIAGELGHPELRWRCEYLAGEMALARADKTGAARRFALAREILDEVVDHIGDPDLSYGYMRDPRRMRLLRRARETSPE